MKFGEKLKKERIHLSLTQQEIADKLGVSLRTYTNYENAEKHPRNRDVYVKLAEIFGVDVNYLLTENEEFSIQAYSQYGAKGMREAQEILDQTNALFAGGDLSDDDRDKFFQVMTEIYFDSKEKAKKYTPKKYRKNP